MPVIPVCDILSVSPEDFGRKKLPNMPRQSARIKSAALNKTSESGAHQDDEMGNKLKDGYDVKTFYPKRNKASIDILNELECNNSRKKRKASSERKAGHADNKEDAVKQIKVEEVKEEEEDEENREVEEVKEEEEDEENREFEYCNAEESFEGLSEYEKMCRKNIEEKMAFFAALNFEGAKQEFLEASASVKVKKTATEKPKKLHMKKEKPTAIRKSSRLQGINPEGKPVPKPEIVETVPEQRMRKPHKPLTFEEVLKSEKQSSEELLKDVSGLSQEELKFESVPYDRYESYFRTMRINPSLVTKVAPSRIFSVAVHPSTSKTLICAGSKYGHLSFWDVESKNPQGGVYVYEPHSAPVNCVAFNVDRPHEVISLSYDGTVRCGHLDAGIFDEVFHTSDGDEHDYLSSLYFDFLSPDSLLISLSSGQVTNVDMRTPRNVETSHSLHRCPVKTVSVHPVKKHYFITSGRNGVVSLWDLRYLKKKSIADVELSRSVNSSYFSPLTGNSVLTTSMDNKLCVFDTTELKEPIKLKTTIRHDNHTGRWLTQFRSVWLPYNEDAFIVGSMQQPRRIEVYRTNGRLAHNFCGEDLAFVCSINAFHPSRPILAGANSSGKLLVFKGKE